MHLRSFRVYKLRVDLWCDKDKSKQSIVEGRSLKVSELFLLQSKLEKKKVNEHKAEEEKASRTTVHGYSGQKYAFQLLLTLTNIFFMLSLHFSFHNFYEEKLSRRDFRNFLSQVRRDCSGMGNEDVHRSRR